MRGPKEIPTVALVGEDGNAFSIMGRVSKALQASGADDEYIKKYQQESMSGDYNNLLATAMKYVETIEKEKR